MKPFFLSLFFFILVSGVAHAQTTGVTFDGFVDTYYAYDFNGPPTFDRAYATQPARSDEFNVNLISLGASLAKENVRGRLALQAGTSVQSNYAGEPSIGAVSGPSLSRNIQEAYLGTKLGDRLWIDGGIYFSHVGGESFISKSNLTYTRSLVADFSPYYQSGVRLNYAASTDLAFQLHVVNGWQNISETNHSKMLGTQVSYVVSPEVSVAYNTLVGRENRFRHFHDVVINYKPTERLTFLLQYDFGQQLSDAGHSEWSGWLVTAKQKISETGSVVARIEDYRDPDQVIVATSTPHGFQTRSASLGFDQSLPSNVMWRSEVRGYWTDDAIYPSADGLINRDALIVTSLSASF